MKTVGISIFKNYAANKSISKTLYVPRKCHTLTLVGTEVNCLSRGNRYCNNCVHIIITTTFLDETKGMKSQRKKQKTVSIRTILIVIIIINIIVLWGSRAPVGHENCTADDMVIDSIRLTRSRRNLKDLDMGEV